MLNRPHTPAPQAPRMKRTFASIEPLYCPVSQGTLVLGSFYCATEQGRVEHAEADPGTCQNSAFMCRDMPLLCQGAWSSPQTVLRVRDTHREALLSGFQTAALLGVTLAVSQLLQVC